METFFYFLLKGVAVLVVLYVIFGIAPMARFIWKHKEIEGEAAKRFPKELPRRT